MQRTLGLVIVLVACSGSGQAGSAPAGNPEEGARVFRSCVACHSLEPGRHRTGPSLAGIFGRKAGGARGFTRYSPALERADVVWNAASLDAWLTDPAGLIPGNRMTFPGIKDAQARADLIEYLEVATAAAPEAPRPVPPDTTGEVEMLDLRRDVGPNNRVTSIRYCGDTYTVGVESGEAHQFWEFNLRFKTDSSDLGPQPTHPVLIPASMMGDRAFVIFADPAEISAFIEKRC